VLFWIFVFTKLNPIVELYLVELKSNSIFMQCHSIFSFKMELNFHIEIIFYSLFDQFINISNGYQCRAQVNYDNIRKMQIIIIIHKVAFACFHELLVFGFWQGEGGCKQFIDGHKHV
jgi:hypothetical protein